MYARDRGSPPLLTHVTLRVAVEDENDHAPTFGSAHLSLEVPEGQDPQTLTVLRASDPDVGANGQLQYRILGENYPTSTHPAPTCPVLLLDGLCQPQCVWCLGFLSLLFVFSFFHSRVYVFLSLSFYASSALYLPLCLSVFSCFFFCLCGALVLKLFALYHP